MKKISPKSDLMVEGLLDYLNETGEQKLLPEVVEELVDLSKKTRVAEKIIVNSVSTLLPDQEKRLKSIVSKLTNLDLPIVNKINKNLIGGVTVQIADWFYDGSLLHELQTLKAALLK